MWKNKGFGEVKYLYLPTLVRFGIKENVFQLITCLPEWEYFFLHFRKPTYALPTWEILATLLTPRQAHVPNKKNINFMVFGEEFQLSVDDLVVRLGFYTEKTFNYHHFMQSLTGVPDSPGQKASPEIVSKMDLLCLYNIVNRVPIHLSVVMAIMFHKNTKKDLATLYIGPFITKLLKSLGFEDKFKELQPIVDMIP
nr:uncharacterized protein LOC110914485 [Ipomoea trifida]